MVVVERVYTTSIYPCIDTMSSLIRSLRRPDRLFLVAAMIVFLSVSVYGLFPRIRMGGWGMPWIEPLTAMAAPTPMSEHTLNAPMGAAVNDPDAVDPVAALPATHQCTRDGNSGNLSKSTGGLCISADIARKLSTRGNNSEAGRLF